MTLIRMLPVREIVETVSGGLSGKEDTGTRETVIGGACKITVLGMKS